MTKKDLLSSKIGHKKALGIVPLGAKTCGRFLFDVLGSKALLQEQRGSAAGAHGLPCNIAPPPPLVLSPTWSGLPLHLLAGIQTPHPQNHVRRVPQPCLHGYGRAAGVSVDTNCQFLLEMRADSHLNE